MIVFKVMEPENSSEQIDSDDRFTYLNQVTPLSKYLAIALFIVLPFVGGVIGYTLATENLDDVEQFIIGEAKSEQEDVAKSNASQVELLYESQTFTINIPGEQPKEYLIDVPYVESSTEKTQVFSERFISSAYGPTVEQAVISPSGNYIFFALSNKHDPFVRPYVYDIANQIIHVDCLSGVIDDYGRHRCRELYGVLGEDDIIEVHWTKDDILTLTVTGESRQEPFILRSVEGAKPWQTIPISGNI